MVSFLCIVGSSDAIKQVEQSHAASVKARSAVLAVMTVNWMFNVGGSKASCSDVNEIWFDVLKTVLFINKRHLFS